MKVKRLLFRILIAFSALVVAFLSWVYLSTFHPAPIENVDVHCTAEAPTMSPHSTFKVLDWNVQYFAGKNYVFFYDVLDGSGPDERPTRQDVDQTLKGIADVILEENPDFLLLQELDQGAARTDHRDEVAELKNLLGDRYPCYVSTFYWKASFVPHPRIMGSAGIKLAVFSRYRIEEATRLQLPLMEHDPISAQFNFKRAILETKLPVKGKETFVLLNTHLDAFAQGMNTMERQVEMVRNRMKHYTDRSIPWVAGGDFNLLPPGRIQYDSLNAENQAYYTLPSAIESIFQEYDSVPDSEEARGSDRKMWFTHSPNSSPAKVPDRTIDYLFFSPDTIKGIHSVRHRGTYELSDHMPVLSDFQLK